MTSPAEFARNQGWGPGTRVEGTTRSGPEKGSVVELEITAIGKTRVLGFEVSRRGEDVEHPVESMWYFDEREWVVTRKRRALGISPLRDADRDYMLASLEYGTNPLVGGWR